MPCRIEVGLLGRLAWCADHSTHAESDRAFAELSTRNSGALVEFVDIMPTLIDLAGLEMPDVCPPDASKVKLCREGSSLKPVISAPETTKDWRPAAFMQYVDICATSY